MIRAATRDDMPAMLAIYAPYILETAITFEYEVPSPGDFMRRAAVLRIARKHHTAGGHYACHVTRVRV